MEKVWKVCRLSHQTPVRLSSGLPKLQSGTKASAPGDVDRFVQEAVMVGARVRRCRRGDIHSSILQILNAQPADASVQFENRELLHYCGWESGSQKLCGLRLSELHGNDELICRDFEIASVTAGITGADYGLADTGTLVMRTSEERGRLLSLLPPVHIAIVPQDRILPDLASFLAMESPPSSAIIFITGPSKTADIEQRLTTGVHGPGEIHIVVVQP